MVTISLFFNANYSNFYSLADKPFMVFDNPFIISERDESSQNNVQSNHKEPSYQAIDPVRRILAFIIDMSILLPIFKFFFLKEKNYIFEKIILESSPSANLIIRGSLQLANLILLILLIYALCLSIWGTTPGLFIFRAKIINQSTGRRPSFINSFFRGLFHVISIIALGIPTLLAFSHKKKLTFHDLASDTLPIGPLAKKNQNISSAFQFLPLLRLINIFAFTMSLFFLLSFIYFLEKKIHLSKPVDVIPTCKINLENLEESSLEMSIIGVLTHYIGPECLNFYIKNYLDKKNEEMIYFSQMLLIKDEPEIISEYQKKICQNPHQSNLCKYWRIWQMKPEAEDLINPDDNILKYFLIINYLNSLNKFKESYPLLKFLPKHDYFSYLKLYTWIGYHNQMNSFYDVESIIDLNNFTMDHEHMIKVYELICDQNLSHSCNQKTTKPCNILINQFSYLKKNASENDFLFAKKISRALQASFCDHSLYEKTIKSYTSLPYHYQKELEPLIYLNQKKWEKIKKKLDQLSDKPHLYSSMEHESSLRVLQSLKAQNKIDQIKIKESTVNMLKAQFGNWLYEESQRTPANLNKVKK